MGGEIVMYGDLISGNCLKGKWIADQLGLAYRWIDTPVMSGKTREPEFLALNPAGQVPVVVFPDGRTLAQSNAIMLHFAEGSRLIPQDAFARAKMYEWLFWEQYNHEPSIAVRRFRLAYQNKRVDEIDPTLLTKGEACLDRMEVQLRQTPFLVGDLFTLADVAVVAYTRMAEEGQYDLSKYSAVQSWIARVERELGLEPYRVAA